LPKFREIAADYFWGAAHVTSRELARLLKAFGDELFFQAVHTHSWGSQTNQTTQYVGGFYEFFVGNNDFSPSVNFGTVNSPMSAHIFVVTGAVTVDEVTIRVTGTSIDDNGVRTATDTADIVIPAGTPADSYFEAKKFLGQVAIETVAGTAVQCNYGWSKYFDDGNTDFQLLGFEALWESDSTDATSNIELLHHKATGWTYNVGAAPTPPTPLASRSVDLDPEDVHEVGPGAWKRTNIDTRIQGSKKEGILWRVTSGTTGIGTLSFRLLNIGVDMRNVSQGSLLE
jgi:hypothetical protein